MLAARIPVIHEVLSCKDEAQAKDPLPGHAATIAAPKPRTRPSASPRWSRSCANKGTSPGSLPWVNVVKAARRPCNSSSSVISTTAPAWPPPPSSGTCARPASRSAISRCRWSRACSQHQAETDERISRYTENYELGRLAVVDRNILRLAIYEMLHRPDIPPVVSINEAIEIAKRFGTEESSRFVNGILDRVKLDLKRPLRTAEAPNGASTARASEDWRRAAVSATCRRAAFARPQAQTSFCRSLPGCIGLVGHRLLQIHHPKVRRPPGGLG